MAFGSVFTTIYSLRFLYGAFARKGREEPTIRVTEMHRPSLGFLIPPGILAVAGLGFGLLPNALDHAIADYTATMPGSTGYHLALWHGVNMPLLLSAVILGAGAAAFVLRHRLERFRVPYLPLGNADRMYDAAIRCADRFAVRLTAFTQRGSIRSSAPVPTTHGRRSIDPMQKIADSSPLMIGVPASMPKTPTLVMVNVPLE